MVRAQVGVQRMTIPINIYCFDGMQLLDIAGPAQVFSTANDEGIDEEYTLTFFSIAGGLVTSASGLPVLTQPFDECVSGGALIFPGGPGARDAELHQRSRHSLLKLIETCDRICSVCTGAFILADLGVLKGHEVATHWRYCQDLAENYPDIRVDGEPLFIHSGRVWSSAGVTAGIDLCLALLEKDQGKDIAARVARRLVVHLRRSGGQKQFSDALQIQLSGSGQYSALLAAITAQPTHAWDATNMASFAGQSLRNFHRQFKRETKSTPAKVVEKIRCDLARNLLETTNLRVSTVAKKSGFGTENTMRKSLWRQFERRPEELRVTEAR